RLIMHDDEPRAFLRANQKQHTLLQIQTLDCRFEVDGGFHGLAGHLRDGHAFLQARLVRGAPFLNGSDDHPRAVLHAELLRHVRGKRSDFEPELVELLLARTLSLWLVAVLFTFTADADRKS